MALEAGRYNTIDFFFTFIFGFLRLLCKHLVPSSGNIAEEQKDLKHEEEKFNKI